MRGLIANTGVVFEALTERGGQLRSLIENSNRVFQVTAARDEQLKETFIALPTFERESAQTLERLAEFARTTDPLVTQLRPAARELSPTLQDLGALAPDLEALFRELGPLITASRDGFPAAEQVLEDARPLIAQLEPTMRQLTPIFDFLGLYKNEITAFLANTPAATQASDSGGHYLRTTNPLNAENLAVYPRRVGTNRPNPYTKPGIFRQLNRGLPVFENRHCGAGVPNITNVSLPPLPPSLGEELIPTELLNRIVQFAFAGQPGVNGPAPPCRLQGPYNFGGEITQYPHVRARTGNADPGGQVPLRVFARRAKPAVVGHYPRSWHDGVRADRARVGSPAGARAGDRRGAGDRRLRARAADGAERGDGHAGRPQRGQLPGHRALSRAVRRPLGDRAGPRRAPEPRAHLEPRPPDRARGLPVRQQAGRRGGAGRRGLAVRPARADQARAGRVRARHLHQRGGRRDPRPDPGPDADQGGRGGARGGGGAARWHAPRAGRRPSSGGWRARHAGWSTPGSCATCSSSTCATGSA